MKIVAISDLHGLFPKIEEKSFDVLCICGDVFPLRAQHNIPQCENWLRKTFIPWCESLPCKEVLLVAGNHDIYFERVMHPDIIEVFKDSKVRYLENDLIELDGIKFYGTPYCKVFGNWAFMREDDRLAMYFENIPEDLDILLTHDAPYGTSDVCEEEMWWNTHYHIGSIPLRDAIIAKQPKFNLHGHLHSANHECEMLNNTKVYCVSVVDEQYELAHEPLILEIDTI